MIEKEAIKINPLDVLKSVASRVEASGVPLFTRKITPQSAIDVVSSKIKGARGRIIDVTKDRLSRIPLIQDYMLMDEANRALSANPSFQKMRDVADRIVKGGPGKSEYRFLDIVPDELIGTYVPKNDIKFNVEAGRRRFFPQFHSEYSQENSLLGLKDRVDFKVALPSFVVGEPSGFLLKKIIPAFNRQIIMHELGEGFESMVPYALNGGNAVFKSFGVYRPSLMLYPQDLPNAYLVKSIKKYSDFLKKGESGQLPAVQQALFDRLSQLQNNFVSKEFSKKVRNIINKLDDAVSKEEIVNINPSLSIRFDKDFGFRRYVRAGAHRSLLPYYTELAYQRMNPIEIGLSSFLRGTLFDGDIWREAMKRYRNINSVLTGGSSRMYGKIEKAIPGIVRKTSDIPVGIGLTEHIDRFFYT